jgi:diguanylate cyclase (GGDEF)-like protein
LRYLLLNAGLALLCFITGYLGLLLAIPPSYATAVWPASGFALAALLFYGRRLWPGILIGSVLISLKTSFDPATTASILQTVFLAISVGFGSTMQALLGHYLVRSTVKLKSGLLHGREVVYFLTLGGPISCLLGASWGVTTLWLMGFVSSSEYGFSWLTWWIGDTTGVLLMVPLIFAFCGRPKELWVQRRIRVALPMIVMLAATVIIFLIASNQVQGRIESEFRAKALALNDSLEKTIIRNTEVLYSVHGLFNMSEAVSFSKFESYASRALDRNPGVKALSWSAVVSAQQRSEFIKNIQAQGFPEFEITELDASGQLVRAAERESYAVVSYVVPTTKNRNVLGFDSYSDPTRKYALDMACSTGGLVATDAIELVQDSGKRTGVLLILPVYKNGIMPASKSEKTDQLSGYVVGLLRTDDILHEALKVAKDGDLNVYLIDDSEADKPVPLASNQPQASLQDPFYEPDIDIGFLERLTWQKSFLVGQKSWRLKVSATPEYFVNNRSRTAWGVLVGGLLFTASFGMFLLILTGRGILDQRLARELASEVAKREESEKTLFDANEKLEILAKTDSLTQINNRLFIQELGKKLDAETKRYEIQYTALMLDIDHFKQVNDRWGHQTGDVVLQKITKLVNAELRDSDYFGRWGGEEFIVIARNTSLDESIAFARRLCQIIGDHEIDPVGRVTISIGVTSNNGNAMFDNVVQLADKALYQAKENGRNRVESLA